MKTMTELHNTYSEFFSIVEDIKNTHFFVGVSGGMDSMVAATSFIEQMKSRNISLGNITILHFDHNQRKSSKEDALFVRTYFVGVKVVTSLYRGDGCSESDLRKARYTFFTLYSSLLVKMNKGYLILGHHLDDRIETTIMNMKRGCGLPGVVNMRTIALLWTNTSISVFRPLLGFSKDRIRSYIKNNNIPFVEDKTNSDSSYTQRNKLRTLLSLSSEEYEIVTSLYRNLEKIISENRDKITLIPLNPKYTNGYRGFEIDFATEVDIIYIFIMLGFTGISSGFLQEFTNFLTLQSGIIKYKSTIFMRSLKKLYWFDTESIFRKEYKTDIVTTSHTVKNITRFIQLGDKFQGKKVVKILAKGGIPLFARNSIEVVVNNGTIVEVKTPTLGEISGVKFDTGV